MNKFKRIKFTLTSPSNVFINTIVFSIMPFACSNSLLTKIDRPIPIIIEKLFQKVQTDNRYYGSV